MIRAAVRADARTLAELEVRAWRWAFVDIVEDGLMPTVDDRQARWTDEPLDGAFVAEIEGRVVGVVQVGPDPEKVDGTVGRLRGLYVDPAAQGAGLGAALHDHAVAVLQDAGFAAAVLEVFAANGHARKFYERRGWTVDDESGASHWEGIADCRYRRTLSP